jgi:hypothetical protein
MNQKSPPPSRVLMATIVQVLKDGSPLAHEELESAVRTRCEPASPVPLEFLPDQARRQWKRAFQQSLDQLRLLGLVYQSDPGACRCTDLGLQVAAKNPGQISRAWLRRGFADFIHWEYRQEHGNFPSPSAPRAPLVIQRRGRAALQILFNFLVGIMLSLQAFESLQDVEVYANF